MTALAEFWVAVAFGVFVVILLYYKVPKLIAKSLDDRAESDPQGARRGAAPARRSPGIARRLSDEASQRRRGGACHRRPGEARGGCLRARDPRSAQGHGGAAHEARRGEDRARRGAGGRRGARRGRRLALTAAERILREKTRRRRRRRADRPGHPRPQGPAELSAGMRAVIPAGEQSAQVAGRSDDPTRAETATCVGPLLRLTPYGSVSGRSG